MRLQGELKRDEALWLLGSLCGLFRIPFDASLIAQSYPPPFFLAVMFAYSWQLSLIAVGLLGLIALISLLVAPLFRERLDRQFMLGARNQSFLTEYVCGMATVKSLQMEPDIERHYGDLLAQYLAAGFSTKQIGNTYSVIANALEQVMTLSILVVGALLVMQNEGFTVGMRVLQR